MTDPQNNKHEVSITERFTSDEISAYIFLDDFNIFFE